MKRKIIFKFLAVLFFGCTLFFFLPASSGFSSFFKGSQWQTGKLDITSTKEEDVNLSFWPVGETREIFWQVENQGSVPVKILGEIKGEFLDKSLNLNHVLILDQLEWSADEKRTWQGVGFNKDEGFDFLIKFGMKSDYLLYPDKKIQFKARLKLKDDLDKNLQLQQINFSIKNKAHQPSDPVSLLQSKARAWFADEAILNFEAKTGDWSAPVTEVLLPDCSGEYCHVQELITSGDFSNLDVWRVEEGVVSAFGVADSPLPDNTRAGVKLEFVLKEFLSVLPQTATLSQILTPNGRQNRVAFYYWLVSNEELAGFDQPSLSLVFGDKLIFEATGSTQSWQIGWADLPEFDQPTELKFVLQNTGDDAMLPEVYLANVSSKLVLFKNPDLTKLQFKTDEENTQTHVLYFDQNYQLIHQQASGLGKNEIVLNSPALPQMIKFWSVDEFGLTEKEQTLQILGLTQDTFKPQMIKARRNTQNELALLIASDGTKETKNLKSVEIQASKKAITAETSSQELRSITPDITTPFIKFKQSLASTQTPAVMSFLVDSHEVWFRVRLFYHNAWTTQWSEPFYLP